MGYHEELARLVCFESAQSVLSALTGILMCDRMGAIAQGDEKTAFSIDERLKILFAEAKRFSDAAVIEKINTVYAAEVRQRLASD